MSDENKVSKTQLVRELLDKDPTLKPMDIVKIMGEKGVEINNRYVSIIKNKIKNVKSGDKKVSVAKRRMGGSKHEASGSLNDILAIKDIYDSIGSERIISAVKALEKIVG